MADTATRGRAGSAARGKVDAARKGEEARSAAEYTAALAAERAAAHAEWLAEHGGVVPPPAAAPTAAERRQIVQQSQQYGIQLAGVLTSLIPPTMGVQSGIVADINKRDMQEKGYGEFADTLITQSSKQYMPRIDDSEYLLDRIPTVKVTNVRLSDEITRRVKDSYDPDTPMIELPIYIVVLTGFGHASLMIYVGGNLYSIGIGLVGMDFDTASKKMVSGVEFGVQGSGRGGRNEYSASGIGLGPENVINVLDQASMYSPDTLIKPLSMSKHGTPFAYKVIDIGLFKQKHLDRLNAIVEKNSGFADIQMHYKRGATGRVKDVHYGGMYLKMDFKYAYVSAMKIVSATQNLMNCTSFLESIFQERVNCGHRTIKVITDPSACKSKIDYSAFRPAAAPPGKPDTDAGYFLNELITRAIVGGTIDSPFDEDIFTILNDDGDTRSFIRKAFNSCIGALCSRRAKTHGGGRGRRRKLQTRRR